MENSATSSFAKTGQALARDTGELLSSSLEDVRSEAGTAVRKGSRRVQSASKQGLDAITEMAGQARDAASNASASVVAYTKKNPVKALAIAAASGAVLYAAIKALSPSRD
jgi:ElaB/YqjD/DUF883 family membrane-anchored ribosome-binding protein